MVVLVESGEEGGEKERERRGKSRDEISAKRRNTMMLVMKLR